MCGTSFIGGRDPQKAGGWGSRGQGQGEGQGEYLEISKTGSNT